MFVFGCMHSPVILGRCTPPQARLFARSFGQAIGTRCLLQGGEGRRSSLLRQASDAKLEVADAAPAADDDALPIKQAAAGSHLTAGPQVCVPQHLGLHCRSVAVRWLRKLSSFICCGSCGMT